MKEVPDQRLTPPEYKETDRRCWSCREQLYGSSIVYKVDGHWMCEDCFVSFISDEFSYAELAQALDVEWERAGDLAPEELEEE